MARSTGSPLRTGGAGAIVFCVLVAVAVAACGATASPTPSPAAPAPAATPPTLPSARPNPTPTAVATPLPVPTPTSVPTPVQPTPVPPSPSPSEPAGPFEPPVPACPAPPNAVDPPHVTAQNEGGAPVAASMGSSTVMTCSTVGTSDNPEPVPVKALAADPGQAVTMTLDAGWRVLHWEASAHPRGTDDWQAIGAAETPDRPMSISVSVPDVKGDWIVIVSIWAIRLDGRVVAQVSPVVWVRVR